MSWIFNRCKKYFIFLFILFFIVNPISVFADEPEGPGPMVPGSGSLTDDPPELVNIVDPFVRFLNAIVLGGGTVFVIMIAYSAFKFAMSRGDPKAMEGARQALTYTIIGGVALTSIFIIQRILANLFGLTGSGDFGNANTVFNQLRLSIQNLYDTATQSPLEGL